MLRELERSRCHSGKNRAVVERRSVYSLEPRRGVTLSAHLVGEEVGSCGRLFPGVGLVDVGGRVVVYRVFRRAKTR